MTRLRLAFGTALLLLCGVVAYAQEPREEPKPERQEAPNPEPKRETPATHQNEVKPPARADEAKPPKQERQDDAKPPREEAKPAHEQHGQEAERGGKQARPAGKSAHIPEEKFRASFGRQHTFVVNRPVIVQGQPRFQFSGFWFAIVDPWPAEWLYTDDCYVDYVDGDYFLFDVLHPGLRVAVFVVE
jgi:hypothetical protein